MFGGSQGKVLALQLSRLTGIPLGDLTVKPFPDGETYIRFHDDISGKHVFLVNSMYRRPNDILVELLLEISTLKDLGASKITCIIPYLAYTRQDARFNPGEAVSIEITSKLLRVSGLDEIVTIDMHLHRVKEPSKLFKIPVYNLSAMSDLVKYASSRHKLENPIIVGPDEESEQWAKIAAQTLGVDYCVLEKERVSAEEVIVKTPNVNVEGRDVIIVDDIISTGGTMVEAVKALKKLKARNVVATCTHAILVGDAHFKILNAGALDVIATDTIPSPISYVPVAPIISRFLVEHYEL